MILIIDNYDSFVYNLAQYVAEALTDRPATADADVLVKRNDELTIADVTDLDPTGIVVSPGPGTPDEAGLSIPLFTDLSYPTLGVCLGHQALCAANGARVDPAPAIVHGKHSAITHHDRGIYADLPNPFNAGRYHSLAVSRSQLPRTLEETATTTDEDSILMGVRHTEKPHYGVQFHPESILTGPTAPPGDRPPSLSVGKQLISNFISLCNTT